MHIHISNVHDDASCERSSDAESDYDQGVGALALLCARKGCRVVANDLNPEVRTAPDARSARGCVRVCIRMHV